MENKFIRYEKLNKWNILTLCLYLSLSIFLLIYNLQSNYNHEDLIFFYGFGTQFFLYLFQYRALRNFNYFLIWLGIGFVQFCIFIVLKRTPEFILVHSNTIFGLRSTLITLLLFQLLRFISLKIQGKELIAPPKGTTPDFYDSRKGTTIDFVCFIIFLVAIFISLA